jgi:hypothetical protein
MKMSDPNEGIWLTYEGILSEVEYEYAGKFDATENNKQWAVARSMFMAGKRSQQATSQRMYQEGREHAIQEMMDKALGSEADNYKSYDGYVAEWLRSQMEGGE